MIGILVVDDDPHVRQLMVVALEHAGFAVQEAPDGHSALTSVQSMRPDVLVLDVMMPSMDGFEVLRQIRTRQLAPGTKVVMLTTKTEERARLKSWSGGADEYLTKPFSPAHLVDRIRRLLDASDDELALQREAEVDRAGLLDRLETAFDRAARRSAPPPNLDGTER